MANLSRNRKLTLASRAATTTSTEANLKVAFLGDSGASTNFEKVMTMIKNENAFAIVHVGDFDYKNDPALFESAVQKTIGTSIPFFGVPGNHDTANWNGTGGYKDNLSKRTGSLCTGDYGSQAYCNFKGLGIMLLGMGTTVSKDNAAQINFIKTAAAANTWKICAWHKNQNAMQVGGKGDEVGWGAFEACREAGALVMTGHEHSYHRSKTLTSMQSQTIDSSCNSATQECVAPGKTFVVVTGLGGNSIRDQVRCLPSVAPYGCKGEWAKIYTSAQGAKYGALFMEFNYQGDPNKAHGYFKNIDGQIVDDFTVTAAGGTGPTSPPPTITSGGPTATIPPNCPKKSSGDVNCDGTIDITDLEIFRKEYNNILTTKTSDLDGDGTISVSDFEIWRKGYFDNGGTVTSTPTIGQATATVTPTPTRSGGTATPTSPPISPPGGSQVGMWLSPQEIARLPMSGTAWNNLKAAADGSSPGSADIKNQDSNHDVYTLALALVYARTGTATYRTKAATNIMAAVGTEQGGRVLAEARNLPSYIIAADLINLKSYDAAKESQFQTWLTKVRDEQMTECDNLVKCHDKRPNNWGTHAGAARVAIDIYIGDKADLAKAAATFKGWLGDRSAYAAFEYGDLSWQCDSSKPVGVNPKGCSKSGHSIDGAIPDDMRRGCSFNWPPCATNYPWGALEGATVMAELLYRQGYDAYNWSDQALKRATAFLFQVGGSFNPSGDDVYMPWIINHAYGTSYGTSSPVPPGKNMGWTDWTHAGRR